MKRLVVRLLYLAFLKSILYGNAYANDQADIDALLHKFYSIDSTNFYCFKENIGFEANLINLSQQFFSKDLLSRFKKICTRTSNYVGQDIHNGQFSNDQIGMRNVIFHRPLIKQNSASAKVTYDLEQMPYKDFGNFALITLLKEQTSWKIDDIQIGGNKAYEDASIPDFKSLKQMLDQHLAQTIFKSK